MGKESSSIFWSLLFFVGCGAATHPQTVKTNEGVTTHLSRGVKVYVSKKTKEVRVALLNEDLNPLTHDSIYLFVKNDSTIPVNVELANFTMQRGKNALRLRPMQEIIARQEQLTEEAMSDGKWPKFLNDMGNELNTKPRSEITEATHAALGKPVGNTPEASQDLLLDELANEKLLDPRQAKNAAGVLEAHKKLISSLKKNYFQPTTIAPGKSADGFVKYEPPLAPTGNPVKMKVTIGTENHEITIDTQ